MCVKAVEIGEAGRQYEPVRRSGSGEVGESGEGGESGEDGEGGEGGEDAGSSVSWARTI